jgi:hypothetical protein
MRGKEKRVAEGSWRRKAIDLFEAYGIELIAVNSELIK